MKRLALVFLMAGLPPHARAADKAEVLVRPIPFSEVTVTSRPRPRPPEADAEFRILPGVAAALVGAWDGEASIVALVPVALQRDWGMLNRALETVRPEGRAEGTSLRYVVPVGIGDARSGVEPIVLVSPHGAKFTIDLAVTLRIDRNLVLASPVCADAGVSLTGRVNAEDPAPVILQCRALPPRGVEIRLRQPSGRSWSKPPELWRADEGTGSLRGRFAIDLPVGEQRTFDFRVHPPRAGEAFRLTQTSLEKRSWQLSASLGPTYSIYRETSTDLPEVKVSQLGLTGKVQAAYSIVPRRFDLAANVFGTLLPVVATAGTPSARWLGVNLRLGFLIPVDGFGRRTLGIFPGFYLWSMYVSGDAYGVKNLNGPQLVVSYTREVSQRIVRYGAYAKLAMVATGLKLDGLGNREIAAGAYVHIRPSPRWNRPFTLSLDVSNLAYSQTRFSLGLTTISVSAGYSLF